MAFPRWRTTGEDAGTEDRNAALSNPTIGFVFSIRNALTAGNRRDVRQWMQQFRILDAVVGVCHNLDLEDIEFVPPGDVDDDGGDGDVMLVDFDSLEYVEGTFFTTDIRLSNEEARGLGLDKSVEFIREALETLTRSNQDIARHDWMRTYRRIRTGIAAFMAYDSDEGDAPFGGNIEAFTDDQERDLLCPAVAGGAAAVFPEYASSDDSDESGGEEKEMG